MDDLDERIDMTKAFIDAAQAKALSQNAELDFAIYKQRLAKMIEDNAQQGNTSVFTVLPKHFAIEEIRQLSAELTQLGYHVRFEVDEFYYTFNVYWI